MRRLRAVSASGLVCDFARGTVVTLREHERPCRVLDISGPDDRRHTVGGFCVPVVLIGPIDSDVRHGWVEPRDLTLIARP